MSVAFRLGLFAVVLLAGCGDPAEWRPAKGAESAPATKAAYRVQAAEPECTSLGVAHAEGPAALDDIATTAARHGGTHYVVRGDEREEHLETRGAVTHVGGGLVVGRSRTDRVVDRRLWAEVVRCP